MTCNINPSVKTQNKPSNSRKTQLRDNFHQQSTYPRAPEIKPKFDLQAKQGQRKKTRQSKAKYVLKTRTYSKSEYTRDNNDKRDGKVHANDWICNKWSPRIGPIGRTHRVLATGQMDELGANPRIDTYFHACAPARGLLPSENLPIHLWPLKPSYQSLKFNWNVRRIGFAFKFIGVGFKMRERALQVATGMVFCLFRRNTVNCDISVLPRNVAHFDKATLEHWSSRIDDAID